MRDFVNKVQQKMQENPNMAWTDAANLVRNGQPTMTEGVLPKPTVPPVVQNVPNSTPNIVQNTVNPSVAEDGSNLSREEALNRPVQRNNNGWQTPDNPNIGTIKNGYTQDSPFMGEIPAKTQIQNPNTQPQTQNKNEIPGNNTQAHTVQTPEERGNQILKNLNEGYTYNPSLFESRSAFEQAYNYADKPQNEKAILDNFWNSKQPSAEGFFETLRNGGNIPQNRVGSFEANIARMRFGKAKMYASMQARNLVDEVKKGNLIQGSEEWNDIAKMNPHLAHEVETLARLNGVQVQVFKKGDNGDYQSTLELNSSEKMLERFASLLNPITGNDVLREVSTPEFFEYQNKKTKTGQEILQLEKEIESIDEDVDDGLAGSGISGSRKRMEKIIRHKALMKEKDMKIRQYTLYHNAQNEIWERGLTAYKIAEDQNKQLRSAGLTMYQKQFDSNLKYENAWRDFQQKIQMDETTRNNPGLATQAMIDSYRKQGVHAFRSDTEIIEQVQREVAHGRPLGEVLTELNKAFQSKDTYKTLERLNIGRMSEREKLLASQNFALRQGAINHTYGMQKASMMHNYDMKGMMTKYNLQKKDEQEKMILEGMQQGIPASMVKAQIRSIHGDWEGASGEELLFAPEGTKIPTRLKVGSNDSGGKECAEWVNDITGAGLGSSYSSKLAVANKKSGEIGSIAVWQPTNNPRYRQWGHTGIIVGDEGTHWLIKSSNYKADGRITIDRIPKDKIEGYKSTNLGRLLVNQGNKDTPLSKDYRTFARDIRKDFMGDPQIKQFEEVYSQGINLISALDADSGIGDISAVFNFMKSLDPSSVVRESEFEAAAKSAGIVKGWKNIFTKLNTGNFLGDEQKEDFKKIAGKFMENKGKIYDRKWHEYAGYLQEQGIDVARHFPQNAYEKMKQELGSPGQQNMAPQIQFQNSKYQKYYNKYAPKQ